MHNVITGGICGGDERSYHPTQKPRYLLWKLIQVSSLPGDTILDPFAGSGSTAFACFVFGRNSILVEPEPQYSGLIQSIAKKEFNYDVILRGTDGQLDSGLRN
jgi:site-specific DNA-methyltransferase (adenine-specific)